MTDPTPTTNGAATPAPAEGFQRPRGHAERPDPSLDPTGPSRVAGAAPLGLPGNISTIMPPAGAQGVGLNAAGIVPTAGQTSSTSIQERRRSKRLRDSSGVDASTKNDGHTIAMSRRSKKQRSAAVISPETVPETDEEPDVKRLKSGLDRAQLVRSVEILDGCLKHTRRYCSDDTDRLVSLTYRQALALGELMRYSATLEIADVIHYYHILIQCVQYIDESVHASDEVKLECAGILMAASQRMEGIAASFDHDETEYVFKAMEGINIARRIIARAKQIFASDPASLGPIQRILQKLLQLLDESRGTGDAAAAEFKRAYDALRTELSDTIKKLTGKTPNLGNGLRCVYTLIFVMNYATPECEKYVDEHYADNKMDPANGCVLCWLKSFPTLIEKEAGITDASHRGPDGAPADIGVMDRFLVVCSSNVDGDKTDEPGVLEKGRMDNIDMHLIAATNLEAMVRYSNMHGKRPTIVATGGTVRDELFERTDASLSTFCEFGGCVDHSEMFVRGDRLLANFSLAKMQMHSKILARAYAASSHITSSVTSEAVERFAGVVDMTPEERDEVLAIKAEMRRENGRKSHDRRWHATVRIVEGTADADDKERIEKFEAQCLEPHERRWNAEKRIAAGVEEDGDVERLVNFDTGCSKGGTETLTRRIAAEERIAAGDVEDGDVERVGKFERFRNSGTGAEKIGKQTVNIVVNKPTRNTKLGLRFTAMPGHAEVLRVDHISSDSLFATARLGAFATTLGVGMIIRRINGLEYKSVEEGLALLRKAAGRLCIEASFRTGRWTPEEHDLFLRGLKLYGNDCSRISLLVKSRSPKQVWTHWERVSLWRG